MSIRAAVYFLDGVFEIFLIYFVEVSNDAVFYFSFLLSSLLLLSAPFAAVTVGRAGAAAAVVAVASKPPFCPRLGLPIAYI